MKRDKKQINNTNNNWINTIIKYEIWINNRKRKIREEKKWREKKYIIIIYIINQNKQKILSKIKSWGVKTDIEK